MQHHKGAVITMDPDDPLRLGEFDAMFKVPVSIDVGHYKIHEGHHFTAQVYDTTMADTNTMVLAFKTPASPKRAHMTFQFAALVGGHVDIGEGATWDNQTGSKAVIFNRSRPTTLSAMEEDQAQAGFVASNSLVLDPTTFAVGTTIYSEYAFGLKGKIAGSGGDRDEWVLNPATQYGIRFTADGAANKGQLILKWYEHTDE